MFQPGIGATVCKCTMKSGVRWKGFGSQTRPGAPVALSCGSAGLWELGLTVGNTEGRNSDCVSVLLVALIYSSSLR